jgi:hypothetical protein
MKFINAKHTKQYALEVPRAHKFTRVSRSFLERIDAKVRALITAEVQSLPSKGETIK